MNNIYIIGIAGGSGSGKSKLVKNILKEINDNSVQTIEIDSYYKDLAHLTFEEREKNNFDHPDSIDFELLYTDLYNIKKSIQVTVDWYKSVLIDKINPNLITEKQIKEFIKYDKSN